MGDRNVSTLDVKTRMEHIVSRFSRRGRAGKAAYRTSRGMGRLRRLRLVQEPIGSPI